MSSSPFISKSKFLWGLQCPKLLWHAYNAKELIPEPDAATQAIFDQGHSVGSLAKQMFPDGVEVGDGVRDLDETIRLTKEALKLRKPLFESAFSANGGYAAPTSFVQPPKIRGISLRSKARPARRKFIWMIWPSNIGCW